ncbi:MAG TPA: alpha/beta hydrolase [Solirubrobacteraceae bacterium]|nr:alpha/beta hydrolase [Solirubrobacteraceae bacterium]
MPPLSVAGTQLHVERRGTGEPLLLIQGLGGNSLHWGEPFLRELERDFEVILFDNRGAGRSAPLHGDLTTAGMAADALALLDALGIERAHVFGISMGGMVAQELALAAPERIASLVLGCTSCGGTQSRATDQAVIQKLTAAVLSGDHERTLRTGFELVVSARFAADPKNYAAFAEAARRHPATIPLLMSQQAAVVAHDTYSRLRGLTVPTLVIHGTADQMLGAVNGDLVASLIPGAGLERLEGIGHIFFWEQPERSAQLIREHAAAAPA